MELEPSRAKDYDAQIARLRAALHQLDDRASLCVLGRSGVGKSTLINALVGGTEMIVPNGGIGPLTAHALRVQYGETRLLEVRYHSSRALWNLAFGLQKSFQLNVESVGGGLGPPPDEVTADDADEASDVPIDTETEAVDVDSRTRDEARNEMKRVAALIVRDDQNATDDVKYLVKCLRSALSHKSVDVQGIRDEDMSRIRAIRRALEHSKQQRCLTLSESDDKPAFDEALKAHATGYLSPLVAELVVRVPNELLAGGLEIVDLPGVGMASDVYRKKTRDWIRNQAQAVLLVIDHRGLDESVMEMLRQTEFLNRLLYSRDDPEGKPELLVAVSQIDTIAQTDFSNADKLNRRKKWEYFEAACAKARGLVKNQLSDQFKKAVSRTDTSDTADAALQATDALSILGELEPFPISAVEYRRILGDDDDDRSFLRTEAETNVPALISAIGDFSRRFRQNRVDNFCRSLEQFFDRVMATLSLLHQQWAAERREHAQVERLREDLKVFLEPLVADYNRRQGQFAGFIRNDIPTRIDLLVEKATLESTREIERYLRAHVRDTHWATLRAAVRKGGTYYGTSRSVDLPREFALRYEEPIASTWGKELLTPIRQRTREFADDCILLVERIATWAREQGTRVKPDLVDAQAASIREDAKHLTTVGTAAVKRLKEEVKARLIDCIEQPIREMCEQFVAEGRHLGTGTKSRILDLFAEIAHEIASAAKPATKEILRELYTEVMEEIQSAMESHADPIADASESIVESQESYLRRSDAQRKKRIITSIDAALANSGASPRAFARGLLQLPSAAP